MEKTLWGFPLYGILEVHILAKGVRQPVAVAVYSEYDKKNISDLEKSLSVQKWELHEVCHWCISHYMKYQIL